MPGNEHNLAPGSVFGQYQIVRLLAAGGMAAVYEARHVGLKKRVALKILFAKHVGRGDAEARFMREGEAAARIRHPHVVDVSDVGVHAGLPFLVMEFLDGEDLATRLERERALPVHEAVAVIVPVISAVVAAHDAGVVHRDLKPENIFLALGRSGEIEPKVLDFGISKLVDLAADAGITRTSAIMGTPSYMSPEQTAGGKNVDARTDQYSLAVVLYECLTGEVPFDGGSLFELMRRIVAGNAKPPSQLQPAIPAALDAVVLKAMHRDPNERYPSMSGFARALLPFADENTKHRWSGEFANDGRLLATVVADALPMPTPEPSRSVRPPPVQKPVAIDRPAERTSGTDHRSDTIIDPPPGAAMDFSVAGLVGSRARRSTWKGIAVVAAVLVAAGATVVAVRRHGSHAATTSTAMATPPVTAIRPPTFHLEVAVRPSTATLELDGVAVGAGMLTREIARDGRQHMLRASAPGYESQTLAFRDDPPVSSIDLVPISVAPSTAAPDNSVASARIHPIVVPHSSAPILPATLPGEHVAPHSTDRPRQGSSPAGTNGAPILN